MLLVVPTAPGRCLVRRLDYSRRAADRGARALQYLAARLRPLTRRGALDVAESVQQGLIDFGYQAAAEGPVPHVIAWFRRQLVARIPALALGRPPTDA